MDTRCLVQIHGGHARVREADLVLDNARDIVRVRDERSPVVAGLVLQHLQRQRACLFNQIVHQRSA